MQAYPATVSLICSSCS